MNLTKINGIFSIVTPSGIYTDEGCTDLRRMLFYQEEIRFVFSLENRGGIFPIDSRFKVVLLSGKKSPKPTFEKMQHHKNDHKMVHCLFLVGKNATGYDLAPSRAQLGLLLPQLGHHLLHMPVLTISMLAPTTFSLMEFKTQRDIDLAIKIYDAHPLLADKQDSSWNVTIRREFNMTDDSPLFNQNSRGWPLLEVK